LVGNTIYVRIRTLSSSAAAAASASWRRTEASLRRARSRSRTVRWKALARAWRWQRMLDEKVHSSVSDIGEAEGISKSYVSRILRMALLAPEIVEAILAGQTDQTLMLERLERPLPASWEEQRARLAVNVVSPKATRALRASH
jgi:hypothetical protein